MKTRFVLSVLVGAVPAFASGPTTQAPQVDPNTAALEQAAAQLRAPTRVAAATTDDLQTQMAGRWDDITMPSVTIPYRQIAPQAQFVLLESSGHQPFLEEPELALAILRALLAR